MAMHADSIFVNGRVIALEDAPTRAEALAFQNGVIVHVGSNEDARALAGEGTREVDLAGKALLPGFVDAHTHLLRTGMERTFYLDLNGTRSADEVFQRVEAAARAREPGAWVVGRGWDESGWDEARYPAKAELDKVAPEHPVALIRVCGHILSANSRALERVPLPDDPHTVDVKNGWLREEAAWASLDHIEPALDERVEALEAGMAHAHACGITSIHEIADLAAIQAYSRLKRAGRLTLRVRLNVRHPLLDSLIATGLSGEFGDDRLRIGALKLFADGSIGARNAALKQPYSDAPDTSGQLNHAPEDLVRWMRKGCEAGFQLMTHAIGDRAIAAVLDAYETVGVQPGDRARVEHLELPDGAALERMNRMGAVASMQPNFVQWSGPGRMYETRLGKEREVRIDPHRAVFEAGVALAFSSDSMPVDPLYGIRLAVHAPHDAQRVTVEEALRAYTLGGAYAGFSEDDLGSLAPGKRADLIVLDRDPFESPDALGQLKVEQVFVAGERVH